MAKGKHPNISAHIEAARKQAMADADFVIRAVAIFVCGPRDRTITLNEAESELLHAYIEKTAIRVIAHSTYTAVPWTGDPDAARCIREETRVCRNAGISGLVVHLPKAPVEVVMKYAARLIDAMGAGVRIYFETPAVTPKETYYETPDKLRKLFRALRKTLDPELAWFGLCIDTAHLWTNGVDLSDYASAEAWLTELEQISDVLPPDRIMFHLNDSARPRGVGPDEHAGLAQGQIWKEYGVDGTINDLSKSGLAAFVDYAVRHDTPTILERRGNDSLRADYLALRQLT